MKFLAVILFLLSIVDVVGTGLIIISTISKYGKKYVIRRLKKLDISFEMYFQILGDILLIMFFIMYWKG